MAIGRDWSLASYDYNRAIQPPFLLEQAELIFLHFYVSLEAAIKVNVSLYGTLARLAGGKYVAQTTVRLQPGSCKSDLLACLGVPSEERGYLFINAVLCDVPGLETDGQEPLQDGDHVGIFSTTYMWPYQYRDGVKMSECLIKALKEQGAMHNYYGKAPESG